VESPCTGQARISFTSWTEAARKLPPGARVDALLVADRIMEFVSGNGWQPEPWEAGETLRVANARFVHDPLAAAHVYAHSLLEEALEIVAPAAAHDRALLREMELGFDALAHFRSGLALDSASDTARGAWQTAWRLAADLPPVWARYFCVSG
jgi:hypothetical protein